MDFELSFSPLLDWPWLIAAGALAVAAILALVVFRPRGALLRALALVLLVMALANPSLNQTERERLPNVLAIVVDRSPSQNLDGRMERTERALEEVQQRAQALPNTEIRVIEGGAPGSGSDGTELFKALQAGLADVPPDRVAGAIFISDGVIHDVPENAAALGFTAPVHGLVTGRPGERDRRVVLTTAPRFGIVERTQTIGFRIEDRGIEGAAPVGIVARRNGEEIARSVVVPGREAKIEVPIAHAGPNVVELEAAPAEDELTLANNRVALSIEGVREKLRVLLVSGEPHSGERTWRNLLKADANVDLVHFTILRPPEKQDGTPINELSLIAFPTRELFVTRIEDFDLIIFDRYARQGILPMVYFDNIAEYVRRGGAVLVAAGPDYAGPGSLSETPLGSVLPAEPVGGVVEQRFKPAVTDAGKRHPVTRKLPGDSGDVPAWSDWFRMLDTQGRPDASVLMSGVAERPLLVLSREDEGRVAVLLSDHAWLWARGFEGGGPHLDLLRRLSHWLMKEPDLEEEALRLGARAGTLTVERQTMADAPPPVTLTLPSGATRTLTLSELEPGLFRTSLETGETGLHRAEDGTFTALTNVGTPNPREFQDVVSTADRLQPMADASGGSVRPLLANGDGIEVPRILVVREGTRAYGSDWIGVRQAEASVVRGLSIFPVFAGLVGLVLLIGALAAVWAREGR
ncbi:hypothetical protein [Terrihabitans sp. B22-R8]|uniref:hypothetical protein n=1 Tax=Terrihabitans sp. B22-R8 TaxID=3425128 RepID=UPI00403CCFEF